MRILVACEFSGRVRDAFIERGHDAWSCDLTPGQGHFTSSHIQGNVLAHLEGWDVILAFPPCTYLTKGGNGWENNWREEQRQLAFEFVLALYDAPCDRIAIENPVGRLSTMWRKPDQVIQPFWFGDPYDKRTCLWLKSLPPLYIERELCWYGPRMSWTAVHRDPVERSKTFPGIARAMARQWG